MSKKKKEQKRVEKEAISKDMEAMPKVKMQFNRSMFYDDPKVPLYEAGQIYEIEAKNVDRWLKRGGVIVEDNSVTPKEEEKEVVEPEQKEDSEADQAQDEDSDSIL